MRCYVCNAHTDTNALAEIEDEDVEVEVTDYHSLIHCMGTPEQFDEEGYVVLCQACVDRAVNALGG